MLSFGGGFGPVIRQNTMNEWMNEPLHVSGLLSAHHQEITMYTCDNWYIVYWKEDCLKLLQYLHDMVMSRDHTAGRRHSMKIDNSSFEWVERVQIFGNNPNESKLYSGRNQVTGTILWTHCANPSALLNTEQSSLLTKTFESPGTCSPEQVIFKAIPVP
jgi:hypothetical protein